jgi:hypothetical protein
MMMQGKYPQDSNIVDFIEIKLLSMADEYANKGREDLAEAIWSALDRYMDGEIDIIFKNGDPYVTAVEFDVNMPSEKNE